MLGELRTAWWHRLAAAANAVSPTELLAAFASRLPADVPTHVWFDDTLPPTVCEQLAAWCRLPRSAITMLDVSQPYPLAGADVWVIEPETWWHAAPLTLDPLLRLAFCACCVREQRDRGEPVHLRAEWSLGWLTHCPRHGTWLLNDCFQCARVDVLDFMAARRYVLTCRFCGASVDVPLSARPSPDLDEVFHFQRSLLACARGQPVDADWVGPCAPETFLRLIRDLLTLLASLDADGSVVLAEYILDRGWAYARLRRRGYRHWALSSIGERLSLVRAVVSLLQPRRRRRGAGGRPEDPFLHVCSAMSTAHQATVRTQARGWPPSIRRRFVNAAGRVVAGR